MLSRSPSYSGSYSSKNSSKVIITKPSRKGDRQIKNLLIHKNEGLLKKIIREWHLYSLRAFKKRMTTHLKKKKRLQTSVPKKKKKSTRKFETDDSECRSINIQIKNKSFDKVKKYSSTKLNPNFKDTSLKSSLKQWNLPHNKFNYPHIPI